MGSGVGVLKVAAARIGISLDEYQERVARGLKWCGGCRAWQPRADFHREASRGDGLASRCKTHLSTRRRQTYVKKGPPCHHGPKPYAPRDGDCVQARQRVNVMVRTGRMSHPNTLPCADCGHIWAEGERRHEYDHYRGYGAAHHYDVQAVCTTCHHAREALRRTAA